MNLKSSQLYEKRAERFERLKLHHTSEEYQFRAMALVRDYVLDISNSYNRIDELKANLSDSIKSEKSKNDLNNIIDALTIEQNNLRELLNEAIGIEGEDFMKEALNPKFNNQKI